MKTQPAFSVLGLVLLRLALVLASLGLPAQAEDKLFGGTTSWVSGPWNLTGIPGASDNAQFGAMPSSATAGVAINMGTVPYPGNYTNGSIEIVSARNSLNLIIGNSSTTQAGTWTLNGNPLNGVAHTVIRNNGAGTSTLTLQNLWPGGGSQSLSLAFNTPASAVIDATKDVVISSAITRADQGITKIGAGALTLSGAANTYTGNTTVRQGALFWNGNNALGTAGTVYLNDASTGSGDNTALFRSANGGIFGRPMVVNNYGATTTIGREGYVINTTVVTGDLTLNKSVVLQGGAVGAGTQVQADFQNAISGPGGVTISGYKVNFGGVAKAYGGPTVIASGSLLEVSLANVLPRGATAGDVSVNGTFDLNTYSQTINGLAGNGTVATVAGGTPTLTVGDNDRDSAFDGLLLNPSGTLALTKIGTGTLTLSGVSSYGGATTVAGGTLTVNGAIGRGAVNVQSGAVLGGSGGLGGLVTIQSGGTISPGSQVGEVTGGGLGGADGPMVASVAGQPVKVYYVGEQGELVACYRMGITTPADALAALSAPPAAAEAGQKLTSGIPAGTKILGIKAQGQTTVVDFSAEIIGDKLDAGRLETIVAQVRATLAQFGFTGSVRLQTDCQPAHFPLPPFPVQGSRFEVQSSKFAASPLDVGCWPLDVGCSDFGFPSDFGFRPSDFRAPPSPSRLLSDFLPPPPKLEALPPQPPAPAALTGVLAGKKVAFRPGMGGIGMGTPGTMIAGCIARR